MEPDVTERIDSRTHSFHDQGMKKGVIHVPEVTDKPLRISEGCVQRKFEIALGFRTKKGSPIGSLEIEDWRNRTIRSLSSN